MSKEMMKLRWLLLLLYGLFFPALILAQQPVLPVNWYKLDLKADGFFGTSMQKAAAELLKGKKAKPVLVAVIDGLLDPDHEALKRYAERKYTLNLVEDLGKDRSHGSHVAGVVVGSAMGKVRLMSICVLADDDRDELDSDDAAAIRYAVDKGARVINMSYGKDTSTDKKLVDEAVKYAMSKDVLIVHAVGNAQVARNVDMKKIFPCRLYEDGSGTAAAWIAVGASGSTDDVNLLWPYSNYGQNSVDVFAPGVGIYSAVSGNKYERHSGTSMAAPVVAGLAAAIRAYYPKLTAVQVKEIIMSSVVKRDVLKNKCVSGGVVNAYAAFRLAADY